MMEFAQLVGHTLTGIKAKPQDEEVILFDGAQYFRMYHDRDCCESVYLSDIEGDLRDLVGVPILFAEESESEMTEASESGTWTFYHLRTRHGAVVFRFCGESNGYYSESVDFEAYEIGRHYEPEWTVSLKDAKPTPGTTPVPVVVQGRRLVLRKRK